MKKDKKPYSWTNQLLEGLMELLFVFAAIAIGLGIAFVFPHTALQNIPAEVFFFLGGCLLVAVICVAAWIVRRIKKKRK